MNRKSLNFEIGDNVSEAAARGVLLKKMFLEISQNSQENTCARVSFLIKLQAKNTFFTEHLRVTAFEVHVVCDNTKMHRSYLLSRSVLIVLAISQDH